MKNLERVNSNYIIASFALLCALVTSDFGVNTALAQRRTSASTPSLEDLPQRPVDTIQTADRETWVIIFSNNTWEYYRPTMDDIYGKLRVYNENWDTTHIFAYRNVCGICGPAASR